MEGGARRSFESQSRLFGWSPVHNVHCSIPEISSKKMENASISTGGRLTPTSLGDEHGELDDGRTHILDVLPGPRL